MASGIFKKMFAGESASGDKDQLRSIIFSMQDALIAYDTDFRVNFFNPAAEHLFQIKKEDMMGHALSPRDAESPTLQRLAQVMFPTLSPAMVPRSKEGEYPQIVYLSFTDPYLEIRVITSPVVDDSGKVAGFMKIVRDRTHEVSLMKSKSEFITVASHQLRTPTTNIEWTLESLLSLESLPEDMKALVENGLVSARQLKRIIEDLLNITKMEEGRFGYSFAKKNLISFLETILSEALPQAKRVNVS